MTGNGSTPLSDIFPLGASSTGQFYFGVSFKSLLVGGVLGDTVAVPLSVNT
jgi:hypothetical protein